MSLLLVVLTGVTAQENHQKMYALRSLEYEAVRTLSIESGVALPFNSGPISGAELRAGLDRIPYAKLSRAGRASYTWVESRLTRSPLYREGGGAFAFDVRPEFTVEGYLHTDDENRLWEYRWEDRAPFARFPFEVWATPHAYGMFDLSFLKNIPYFGLYPTYTSSQAVDTENPISTKEEDPWTNLPVVPSTIDTQFPHRAFLSVGGTHWNAQVGRDILDWGPGRTGNLYISDYADWHDALQLSTFWKRFKFSWAWVSLDGHIVEGEREFEETTYDPTPNDPTNDDEKTVYTPDIEQKNLIAQRFEWRIWNRLTLAYTEGIILGRTDVELRHLNPIYHYHNLYTNIHKVGNAHRSFEFTFAVTPGFNLYGAISPDQWTSPLEPGTDLSKEPNAFAALAGIDYVRGLGDGYVKTTLEGVYSSTWMYIHNHPLTSITNRRFVLSHHSDGTKQLWIDRPLGHYGGNDFVLLWWDLSYGEAGRYRYGLTTSYEGDGSVPINALLRSRVNEGLHDGPTEEQAQWGAPSSGWVVDGVERVAQWKAACTLYGEITPWFWQAFNGEDSRRSLSLSSQLSAQWTDNRGNVASPWRFDLQWVVSVTVGI